MVFFGEELCKRKSRGGLKRCIKIARVEKVFCSFFLMISLPPPPRHMTKAMRQRLNKFERTRISGKAIKCLRLKIWGGGVRPMRRLVLTSPLDDVSFIRFCVKPSHLSDLSRPMHRVAPIHSAPLLGPFPCLGFTNMMLPVCGDGIFSEHRVARGGLSPPRAVHSSCVLIVRLVC